WDLSLFQGTMIWID
ncbi:hypothetical protein ZOSMA_98G00030, partial [Zostera marina]